MLINLIEIMQNILSKLLRAQFRMAEETMRKPKPKLKEETIFERKEAKRLANVNTWSIDHTSMIRNHQ